MVKWGLDFPEYFPEWCPPSDAKNEEITVFRLCKKDDKVTESDFVSYYLENPEKWKNEVLAYGLSVLSDEDASKNQLKLPAIRKKFKGIARGTVYPKMGVVKATPRSTNKSHCTWWLCEGVKPEKYFELVK